MPAALDCCCFCINPSNQRQTSGGKLACLADAPRSLSVIEGSPKQRQKPERNAAYWFTLSLAQAPFFHRPDPDGDAIPPHTGLGLPTSINNYKTASQTYLEANLIQAIPPLRVPLPEWPWVLLTAEANYMTPDTGMNYGIQLHSLVLVCSLWFLAAPAGQRSVSLQRYSIKLQLSSQCCRMQRTANLSFFLSFPTPYFYLSANQCVGGDQLPN